LAGSSNATSSTQDQSGFASVDQLKQNNESSDTTANSSISNSAANGGDNLTPTGHTSAEQNPNANGSLLSAAQQVRQALDQDSDLAHADITVTPENNKLVLRGTVKNDDLKSKAKDKAQSAANGVQIDSQLQVK
jgi:hypothetical protein